MSDQDPQVISSPGPDGAVPRPPILLVTDGPVQVPSQMRASVLFFASCMTGDRADAAAVVANALPLLEWLQEASSEADCKDRLEALRHQHQNMLRAGLGGGPAAFLAAAKTLYGFIAAGPEAS